MHAFHTVCARIILAAALLAGISCTTMEPNKPDYTGLAHPYVEGTGARVWPGESTKAGQPKGLLFPARGPARATVLCLHGIQTHAAWFAPLAEELTGQGINVIAMDRRGSGMNSGGTFAPGDAESAKQLLADLDRQLADAEALGVPVYLAGTSWASNLAGVHVLRGTGTQPAGLIQVVPATRSYFETFFTTRVLLPILAVINSRAGQKVPFTPEHYQAGRKQPLPRGTNHKVPVIHERHPKLTQLLADDARHDALVQRPTRRLLLAGLKLGREWRGSKGTLRVPVLLIVAGRDQIMDNAAAEKVARERTGNDDKQITIEPLPEAGHGAQITDAKALAGHINGWITRVQARARPN